MVRPDDPRSDEELLAATADDAEAFGVFYRRHLRSVLAYLIHRTGRRDLAADLAARRAPIEEAERRIEEFAASLDPDVRDEKLTELFAGVLETINRDRASLINGIKRYARTQRALSEEIRQANAALRELPREESTPEQRARRRELEEHRDWNARLFDERENSLTYLCQQPVVLEQRAFALAREIAAQLG